MKVLSIGGSPRKDGNSNVLCKQFLKGAAEAGHETIEIRLADQKINPCLAESEDETDMTAYDFSVFTNIEITGADLSSMTEEQLGALYQQAKYCQAMTDADIDTLRELVPEDATFTHMSGMQQTREEYFADIADGSLRYFTIGIDSPVVTVDGDSATIDFTSVLNANAYGARGTYRMHGVHGWIKTNGKWQTANGSR